jgi:hypothetical protein
VRIFIRHDVLAPAPFAAEKVDALVVGDPEEPGLEARRVVERVETLKSLRDDFLHDILAVERRPAHARAKTVQPRPHRLHCDQELRLHRVAFRG